MCLYDFIERIMIRSLLFAVFFIQMTFLSILSNIPQAHPIFIFAIDNRWATGFPDKVCLC